MHPVCSCASGHACTGMRTRTCPCAPLYHALWPPQRLPAAGRIPPGAGPPAAAHWDRCGRVRLKPCCTFVGHSASGRRLLRRAGRRRAEAPPYRTRAFGAGGRSPAPVPSLAVLPTAATHAHKLPQLPGPPAQPVHPFALLGLTWRVAHAPAPPPTHPTPPTPSPHPALPPSPALLRPPRPHQPCQPPPTTL